MAGITCCFGCSDRVLGCHSTCQKYIKEKEEYDKITHQMFLHEASMKSGRRESIDRMKKRRSSNKVVACHKYRQGSESA